MKNKVTGRFGSNKYYGLYGTTFEECVGFAIETIKTTVTDEWTREDAASQFRADWMELLVKGYKEIIKSFDENPNAPSLIDDIGLQWELEEHEDMSTYTPEKIRDYAILRDLQRNAAEEALARTQPLLNKIDTFLFRIKNKINQKIYQIKRKFKWNSTSDTA